MGLKIVALAGGVGGAKLVDGLAHGMPPEDLTVVVNTGDDFEHLGFRICPDLDTMCYTLAGKADPQRGWGRRDESWNFLEALDELGGPTWFRLGDRDLALHVERRRLLAEGQKLSEITRRVCRAWGVGVRVLPMTDDRVATVVFTESGLLPFQEYFVAQRCEPRVRGFTFEGAPQARPAPGVLQSLEAAQAVVLCPSNPWVSLDPILAIPGVHAALQGKLVVGVSPIVAGSAIKGPAAKMFTELGLQPSALAVAEHFKDLLRALFVDHQDADQEEAITKLGIRVCLSRILMHSVEDRLRLAGEVLDLIKELT